MNMEPAKRLALRQAVEKHAESIVVRAERVLSEERMAALRKAGMKQSQMDNLLGVALETSSPTVVVNWIRYQMGRAKSSSELRGWEQGGLGQAVIQDIEELKGLAKQVAEEAFASIAPPDLQKAHIALIRLYVGYLRRWFVAKGGRGG